MVLLSKSLETLGLAEHILHQMGGAQIYFVYLPWGKTYFQLVFWIYISYFPGAEPRRVKGYGGKEWGKDSGRLECHW